MKYLLGEFFRTFRIQAPGTGAPSNNFALIDICAKLLSVKNTALLRASLATTVNLLTQDDSALPM